MKKVILYLFFSFLFVLNSYAQEHKVVIQISSDDSKVQELALNNAANLQKIYGVDNIAIEVVAYGPGLFNI